MIEFLLIAGGVFFLGFAIIFIWGALNQSARISRIEETLDIHKEDHPDV